MPHPWGLNIRDEVSGGLVSAAVAIPLAMGYGMFAFVSLGDKYFAYGALAGLSTAFLVAIVSVLLGDRTPTVYAPRINSTFFLGALLYGLVHSETAVLNTAGIAAILLVFFSTVLLGGIFQALFGLIKVGTVIRFAPHPVFAGFQNTAAALLFLVQLANVSGLDEAKPFTFVLSHPDAIKPLSVFVAALTFAVMWNARRINAKIPPLVLGLAIGTAVYYRPPRFWIGRSSRVNHRQCLRRDAERHALEKFRRYGPHHVASCTLADGGRRRVGSRHHRFYRCAALRKAGEPTR